MQVVKFPLSGDVVQAIWAALLSPFNNQVGLVNINLGKSSAPEVEQRVLDQVGSYGRQLGRIGDAITVLMKHFHPAEPLTEQEQEALIGLKLMLDDIAGIKEEYKREAIRP